MDSNFNLKLPLESMDFLSGGWPDSAIQVLQPVPHDKSIVSLQEDLIKIFENDAKASVQNKDKNMNMDVREGKSIESIPPWKSDSLKSWIWLQQAMHPELNYGRCFRKKWLPWKMMSLKDLFIKRWVKEMKWKRKEEARLQKAEVHAAISVAGVAAALAAVAEENTKTDHPNTTKEAAVASAAALVAARCAQVAESMGAKPEQISAALASAMAVNGPSDILTLTAAAATSLRGAATLRARPNWNERGNGRVPTLPIEEKNDFYVNVDSDVDFEFDFDYEKCRVLLAKGSELRVGASDGNYNLRSVSVVLNSEAKVLLRIKKTPRVVKAFASTQESIIFDLHSTPQQDWLGQAGTDTSHFIVMTTSRGEIKLEMKDYVRYKIWIMTINHMLMLSTTFSGYHLQFFRN